MVAERDMRLSSPSLRSAWSVVAGGQVVRTSVPGRETGSSGAGRGGEEEVCCALAAEGCC